MGIGFDVFKAHVGWNLADSVMGAVSDAIDQNATESAAREKAMKEQSDKNDMLKTLVFMVGNKIELDRAGKKSIASVLSTVQDENISLFSIEDKIDSAYSKLKSQNLKQYFANIAAIRSDREQTCLMYVVILLLYMQLINDEAVLPAHMYNLCLIKRFFGITRAELAECYSALAEKLEKDTDDIADFFESVTSEDAIKEIEAENPELVYDGNESFSASTACENPKKELERIYYTSIQELSGDEDFKQRFFLADSNPKKVIVAVNAYAKNCKGEEILVMYDDSTFANGKAGFLLTSKKLYVCNRLESPNEVELSNIQVITAATPDPDNSFITVNNIKISTSMLDEAGTEVICNFLQNAIPLAMQIEKDTTAKQIEAKNISERIYSGKEFQEIKGLYESTINGIADSGSALVNKKRAIEMIQESFVLANENPNKILAAKKSFAKNSEADFPLAMYDESLSKNGVLGFLLTNKKLYIGNMNEQPIEIELGSIKSIEAKPKMLSSFIAINDKKFESSSLLKKQLFIMADFLQKAIPIAMQIKAE